MLVAFIHGAVKEDSPRKSETGLQNTRYSMEAENRTVKEIQYGSWKPDCEGDTARKPDCEGDTAWKPETGL